MYSYVQCIHLDSKKKLVAVAVVMQLSAEIIWEEELLLGLQNGTLSNNMVTIFMLFNISLCVKAAHF